LFLLISYFIDTDEQEEIKKYDSSEIYFNSKNNKGKIVSLLRFFIAMNTLKQKKNKILM
jgi:hypothetical protein